MLSHVIWAREALLKSLAAKTVLLVLASHADKDNKAYPSIPLLSRECSMTERGVFKAIQFLTQGKPPYLEIERQTGKHNLYRLLMPEPATIKAHEQEDTHERSSPLNIVHPVTTFTPPLNVVHPTPEPGSSPPLNVVHPKVHIKENKGQGKDIDTCAQDAQPPTVSPDITPAEPKRPKKKTVTQLPDDFVLTDDLMQWAEKNGHAHMQERYDYFVEQAKIRGYEYADWNLAFQKSVRENWAKIDIKPLSSQFTTGGYNGKRRESIDEINKRMRAIHAAKQSQNTAFNSSADDRILSGVEYSVER